MKIERLELEAFGPFTGSRLDFSSPLPGLHVVYGANEAGKSSAMRALRALLFGYARSGDDFVHSYDRMLLGGTLSGPGGERLAFRRRKRNKADLFDPADQPLDPSKLSSLLHGLDEQLFLALYAIDHSALSAGGRELLEEEGEVGRILFAAGAGVASMKRLMDELEKEAAALFRPQGSKLALNSELARFSELKRQLREAELQPASWTEHRRALDEAAGELEHLQEEQRRLDREKHRLLRLRGLMGDLFERRDLLGKLKELGEVVRLPDGFHDEWNDARLARARAGEELERVRAECATLSGELDSYADGSLLLAESDAIESLKQRLGEFRKSALDRPKLETRCRDLMKEAGGRLARIRPGLTLDEAAGLAPALLKKSAVQHLAIRRDTLQAALSKAESEVADLESREQQLRAELGELPSPRDAEPLATALAAAERAASLDDDIALLSSTLAASRQQALDELGRIGFWKGSLDAVPSLTLPRQESVTAFEQELAGFRERLETLQARMADQRDSRTLLLGELRQIELSESLPSEEELARLRERRDRGWELLRRTWVGGEELSLEASAYDPDHSLHEAYERSVADTDLLADRLYREAGKTQKVTMLKAAIGSADVAIRELADEYAQVKASYDEVGERWVALWAPLGFKPETPLAMRPWLSEFEALRERIVEMLRQAGALEAMEVKRSSLAGAVEAALASLGETLPPPAGGSATLGEVTDAGGKVAGSMAREHARRSTLEAQHATLAGRSQEARRALTRAREELSDWQAEWMAATDGLGLADKAHPFEAIALLDELKASFDSMAEARGIERRISGIDRDAALFTREVASLAARVAPELAALEPEAAVAGLGLRLDEAKRIRTLKGSSGDRLQALEEEREALQARLLAAGNEEARLLALAGSSTAEELLEAERRSEQVAGIEKRLLELEASLTRSGGGGSIRELEEEAASIDFDALPGRIESITAEIGERLLPEIARLSEIVGREKGQLEQMDGSARAAGLAESMQASLAAIRRMSERYIRLRLAVAALREEAERYRSENQGPLLEGASAIFSRLTLGSFTALRAEINEKGALVLLGVRPGGESWLGVEAMSSGTRDQLYLALRIATLEWRFEHAEPMPFIVDDILVHFDDLRARASLEALAGLGRRTQVVLFTHHATIRDMAAAMQEGGGVFLHELQQRPEGAP